MNLLLVLRCGICRLGLPFLRSSSLEILIRSWLWLRVRHCRYAYATGRTFDLFTIGHMLIEIPRIALSGKGYTDHAFLAQGC
jgi:hypothetical protein